MRRGAHGPTAAWQRRGDILRARVELSAAWLPLARDYALHRLREARARPRGILHPTDIELDTGQVLLRFAPGALDADDYASDDAEIGFARWRDRVLVPCLDTLASTLATGITGFAPHLPVGGRWVPPVAWFLAPPPGDPPARAVRADLALAARWLDGQLAAHGRPRHPADQRLVDSLLQALRRADLPRLRKLLRADVDDARRRERLRPQAPSFLALLTEAELLERALAVFPYRALGQVEAEQIGLRSRGRERVIEVDRAWQDPHFPPIARPSPQEIWDALIDESRTTPVLALSERLPNPLKKAPSTAPRLRWVGVHVDQPYLTVLTDGAALPDRGFVTLDNPGDDTLMKRKRAFTRFAGEHPALRSLLVRPPAPTLFTDNPQERDDLEEVVLGVRGIFPVQGPPDPETL